MRSARITLQLLSGLVTVLGVFSVGSVPLCAAGDSPTRSPFRLFDPPASNRISSTPHPAVVRVAADEGKSMASGSGSFVAARGQYGLVVTNWHVVRDASGPIEVYFPDGFRSSGTVLGTDKDWDLAGLLIWRPNVTPLKVSTTAPQPGDVLTIAGYGQGSYQAATGKCTQYVAPSTQHPFEIVELSAQARQGDSGGPILNAQGELAGVLFGAARGTTSGSYCGRVRWFLTSLWPDLDKSEDPSTSSPPGSPTPEPSTVAPVAPESFTPAPSKPLVAFNPTSPADSDPPKERDLVPIDENDTSVAAENPYDTVQEPPGPSFQHESPIVVNTPPPATAPSAAYSVWESIAGKSRFEQAKTIFAILGILAVWSYVTRWMGK